MHVLPEHNFRLTVHAMPLAHMHATIHTQTHIHENMHTQYTGPAARDRRTEPNTKVSWKAVRASESKYLSEQQ